MDVVKVRFRREVYRPRDGDLSDATTLADTLSLPALASGRPPIWTEKGKYDSSMNPAEIITKARAGLAEIDRQLAELNDGAPNRQPEQVRFVPISIAPISTVPPIIEDEGDEAA